MPGRGLVPHGYCAGLGCYEDYLGNEEIAAGMEQLRTEQRAWRLAEMRRLEWIST